jgi:hypothetical protein
MVASDGAVRKFCARAADASPSVIRNETERDRETG